MRSALLEENRVAAVRGIDLVHTDEPHPFHLAHRVAAAENWRAEISRTPQLFDGPVMLASAVGIDQGILSAACHIVPFSTFLFWRKMRPVPDAHHVFAMPMLLGSDDRVLLGRMGEATANAGMFYCPSGSFDPDDILDGHFEPETNMQREVGEETGLDLRAAEREASSHVIAVNGAIVVFRRYRFADAGRDLAERVGRFIAAQADSELADVICLGRHDRRPSSLAPHMTPILDWHFAGA